MIGLNTCIVFSFNQSAAGKVLVSISIFLSWHRVIARIMMFAGGGSSPSLFASQWLAAILILPIDLPSTELSSFMGFSLSVCISIRIWRDSILILFCSLALWTFVGGRYAGCWLFNSASLYEYTGLGFV